MSETAVNLEDDFGVDVEGVDAWGGEASLIPQGKYTAQIVFAAKEASKSTGQPVAKVTYEIVSDGEAFGKKVTKSYSLQPKALGRFKALLMACRAPLSGAKVGDVLNAFVNLEIVHKVMPVRTDEHGNAQPARTGMEVINEQAVEDEPAADQAAAPAAAPAPAAPAPAAAAPAPAAPAATAAVAASPPKAGARRAPVATGKTN